MCVEQIKCKKWQLSRNEVNFVWNCIVNSNPYMFSFYILLCCIYAVASWKATFKYICYFTYFPNTATWVSLEQVILIILISLEKFILIPLQKATTVYCV